ncbi:YggT family protein [Paenibacillus sp. N1-5-1-14]|uniref:YggT family protein n=1 Tax=Paenibacillus radicibacter TaxID=2972488 RepID=UPI002158E095|nr:YggT family protein [Paenibacillus radicibacter]MCR8641903.1 YggT family protein [Paenibacillus radicibacter]
MSTNIFNIIDNLFLVYRYMIIGYILLSWFPNARESSFGAFLARIVEPYLTPFRRFVPPLGPIDFSPIVALFALIFLQQGVKYVIQLFFF